jgi:GNAT superfamily N-acetyltransferase
MKHKAADIRIRPIRPGEVDLLCQRMGGAVFGADDNTDHRACANQQSRGEGVYLIAWDEDVPVGHLFILWTGNTEVPRIVDRCPQAAQFADCPELCELYVVAERRSQGIGTQLLRQAVELARKRGASQATICVDTDNPRARSLYERLGFVESGIGTFTTSGVLVDEAGREKPWQNGPQVMLVKKLGNG